MNGFCEAQTGKVFLNAKEDSQGMAQAVSHPARGEMLEITSPNPFSMKPFDSYFVFVWQLHKCGGLPLLSSI